MKKANKFFVYGICILLATIIACSTLMVGATDNVADATPGETTAEVESSVYVPTELTKETEKDITDTISEIVSKNEWEDDLSEAGDDIKDFSGETTSFLEKLINAIRDASQRLTEFLKQIFRIGFFD